MGFKDVIEEGEWKLREKNLTIVRYRSILRDGWKRKFADFIYESVKATQQKMDDSDVPDISIEMTKLKRMKWSV